MSIFDGMELFPSEIIEYLDHSFQEKRHLEELLITLNVPPLFTTIRTPIDHANKDNAARLLTEKLSEQCKEMGWSSFKHFIHPAFKDCIIVENRGPNELELHPKEIIVDLYCGMAVLRGAQVFKQGIKGAPHRLQKGDHVSVFSDVSGKCLMGSASSYSGDKIHVGNGISQVTRFDLFNANTAQSGIGVLMTDPLYQAPSLANLDPSLLFPQNLPSIVCGHALDPQPGESVLDLCAAPGGKTMHIASLMENKGRVVALEKSSQRLARMKDVIERVNCSAIEAFVFDSTKAVDCNAAPEGGPPYPPATFDRILVDAPCSALGQRPCLKNQISLNQLKSFPAIQHKLLCAAAQLLKPGGVLVYSTCTLPVEENENQVYRILEKYPCLNLVQMPYRMGTRGMAGSLLSDEDKRSLVMRFDPSMKDDNGSPWPAWDRDTIGFFIAKFQKA